MADKDDGGKKCGDCIHREPDTALNPSYCKEEYRGFPYFADARKCPGFEMPTAPADEGEFDMRPKFTDGLKLGAKLKELRNEKGLTLRDVERETEGRISNPYLSQLECGYIKNPAPQRLHLLAKFYGVNYLELMVAARYLPEECAEQAKYIEELQDVLGAAKKCAAQCEGGMLLEFADAKHKFQARGLKRIRELGEQGAFAKPTAPADEGNKCPSCGGVIPRKTQAEMDNIVIKGSVQDDFDKLDEMGGEVGSAVPTDEGEECPVCGLTNDSHKPDCPVIRLQIRFLAYKEEIADLHAALAEKEKEITKLKETEEGYANAHDDLVEIQEELQRRIEELENLDDLRGMPKLKPTNYIAGLIARLKSAEAVVEAAKLMGTENCSPNLLAALSAHDKCKS